MTCQSKAGRPRKEKDQQRTRKVQARFSPVEMVLIEKAAHKIGFSTKSDYVRSRALHAAETESGVGAHD